jgi:hypothetical protein
MEEGGILVLTPVVTKWRKPHLSDGYQAFGEDTQCKERESLYVPASVDGGGCVLLLVMLLLELLKATFIISWGNDNVITKRVESRNDSCSERLSCTDKDGVYTHSPISEDANLLWHNLIAIDSIPCASCESEIDKIFVQYYSARRHC